jgi:hypothetical protein
MIYLDQMGIQVLPPEFSLLEEVVKDLNTAAPQYLSYVLHILSVFSSEGECDVKIWRSVHADHIRPSWPETKHQCP